MLRQLEEFSRDPRRPARADSIIEKPSTSQEEAAAAHISGWSWAKVVIVKEREGLAMAVLPACCAIDMDRLKGLIGRGEIELASVEEIIKTFPGCASWGPSRRSGGCSGCRPSSRRRSSTSARSPCLPAITGRPSGCAQPTTSVWQSPAWVSSPST